MRSPILAPLSLTVIPVTLAFFEKRETWAALASVTTKLVPEENLEITFAYFVKSAAERVTGLLGPFGLTIILLIWLISDEFLLINYLSKNNFKKISYYF